MRMGLVHPWTRLLSGRGKEKAAAVLCHSLLQDLEQTLLSSSVSRRALKKPFPWVSYKPFSLVTAWQGLGASGGCSRGARTLPSPTASEQRAGCSVCLPMGHRALTLAVPSNFRAELGPRGHTRCLPLPSEDLDHGSPESCRMPRGAQPRSGHSEPGVDVCQTPWAVRTSAAEAAMCCAPAYCWLSAHVSWGC